MKIWILIGAAAMLARAQDFQKLIPFEQLQAKAHETVEVNLDGNMLAIAKKFLSAAKPEEAEARKLLDGVRGIYVRVLNFQKEGEYSMADVEKIRAAIKGPGWQSVVDVRSSGKGDNAGVYMKTDGNEIQGLVVVAAEPRELTLVNVVGNIHPDQLRKLGGLNLPGLSDAAKAMRKAETKGSTKAKDDE